MGAELKMKDKEIYCSVCAGEIYTKEDLVVAKEFVGIFPFHASCYSKSVKGMRTLFLSNTPINGFASTIGAVLLFLIGLIAIFFIPETGFKLVGILLITVPLGLRLYSWFKYERYLY